MGPFVLSVWLAVSPPTLPQRLLFGPFWNRDDCERAFVAASHSYIGTVPVQHECQTAP